MIVVFGATGRVGRHVVRGLVERGERVRAVTRDVDRARTVLGPVPEVVRADLDEDVWVAAAVRGARAVLVLSPHDPRQDEQQNGVIDAAVAAGVPRVVKLSALDAAVRADSPSLVGRLHWRSEQRLRGSGVGWTVVRPTPYMQNTLEWLDSAVRGGRLMLPFGRSPVALVDAADVASVLVAALTEDGHSGRTYVVTGPESIGFDQVAEVLGRARGRRLGYLPVPARFAASAQRRRGVEPWLVEHQSALAAFVSAGAAAAVTRTVPDLTGHPARRFADFAAAA